MIGTNDVNISERMSWIYDGTMRFLDKSANKTNKIGLASFPGTCTGNLRNYIEQITGVHTGSDTTLHLSTSQ